MTQEDKTLLLKDLSARFSYGVMFCAFGRDEKLKELSIVIAFVNGGTLNDKYSLQHCKPYLRPMSSMTEEEKEIYHNLCYEEEREEYEFGEWVTRVYYHDTIDSIDYLNSIHVDYRGLIPKGLAIEVTEQNNPYEYH